MGKKTLIFSHLLSPAALDGEARRRGSTARPSQRLDGDGEAITTVSGPVPKMGLWESRHKSKNGFFIFVTGPAVSACVREF